MLLLKRIFLPTEISLKCGFLVRTLKDSPPGASALALVFRGLEALTSNQSLAFSAEKHLDITRAPGNSGIPAKRIYSVFDVRASRPY